MSFKMGRNKPDAVGMGKAERDDVRALPEMDSADTDICLAPLAPAVERLPRPFAVDEDLDSVRHAQHEVRHLVRVATHGRFQNGMGAIRRLAEDLA